MTNKQAKLCKIILKYKKLDTILEKTKFPDYEELEMELLPFLIFPDDDDVIVPNNDLLEEYENRRRAFRRDWVTWILSICAIIISIITLILQMS